MLKGPKRLAGPRASLCSPLRRSWHSSVSSLPRHCSRGTAVRRSGTFGISFRSFWKRTGTHEAALECMSWRLGFLELTADCHLLIRFVIAASVFYSVMVTNAYCNSLPFGADISAIWPRYFSIVRGQVFIALISLPILPWQILYVTSPHLSGCFRSFSFPPF